MMALEEAVALVRHIVAGLNPRADSVHDQAHMESVRERLIRDPYDWEAWRMVSRARPRIQTPSGEFESAIEFIRSNEPLAFHEALPATLDPWMRGAVLPLAADGFEAVTALLHPPCPPSSAFILLIRTMSLFGPEGDLPQGSLATRAAHLAELVGNVSYQEQANPGISLALGVLRDSYFAIHTGASQPDALPHLLDELGAQLARIADVGFQFHIPDRLSILPQRWALLHHIARRSTTKIVRNGFGQRFDVEVTHLLRGKPASIPNDPDNTWDLQIAVTFGDRLAEKASMGEDLRPWFGAIQQSMESQWGWCCDEDHKWDEYHRLSTRIWFTIRGCRQCGAEFRHLLSNPAVELLEEHLEELVWDWPVVSPLPVAELFAYFVIELVENSSIPSHRRTRVFNTLGSLARQPKVVRAAAAALEATEGTRSADLARRADALESWIMEGRPR